MMERPADHDVDVLEDFELPEPKDVPVLEDPPPFEGEAEAAKV
jgi:hypothetical protein